MKVLKLSNLATVAATAIILAVKAQSQTQLQVPAEPAPLAPTRLIVVSLEDRKLALLQDGQVVKTYSVAVGKPSTPSPVGTFTIQRRVANPVYQHQGKLIPPGPRNPVGSRWMGLSIPGYGIHGTNDQKSIGKPVSHGCIRMAKADLEEFYALVSVGDTVQLIGQRNDLTAQLFGPAPAEPTTPAAQPLETAALAPALIPGSPATQQPTRPATSAPVLIASR